MSTNTTPQPEKSKKRNALPSRLFFLALIPLTFMFATGSFAQIPMPTISGLSWFPHADGTCTIEFRPLREETHWPPRVGAPFSALYEATVTQTLPTDVHVKNRGSYERLFRDSEGRGRREQLLGSTGDETNGIFIVSIFDPVGGYQYIIDDQNRVAHRAPMKSNKPEQTSSGYPNLKAETDYSVRNSGPNTTYEYFKDQQMEGVPVIGRRVISSYPAGFQDSGVPFTITMEEWVCPELDLKVLDRRTDSRGTDRVFRMTNINRSEPDASLFRVPEDYKVVDEPAGFTMTLRKKQ